MDPNRLHHTLPSNISSSSINGGSTNKNNLLSVNNTSGSSLGRSGLLHATSNGSWASSGNHRYPIDLIYSLDILTKHIIIWILVLKILIDTHSFFQPFVAWIRKIRTVSRTSCVSRRYLSHFWFRQKSKRVSTNWGKLSNSNYHFHMSFNNSKTLHIYQSTNSL